jgi:hypothetical protein
MAIDPTVLLLAIVVTAEVYARYLEDLALHGYPSGSHTTLRY